MIRVAVATVGTVVALVVSIPALGIAIAGVAERGWLFPGDPPSFDLALPFAVCALFVGAVGLLLFHRQLPSHRLGRAARLPFALAATASAVALLASTISGMGIGYRQTPAWRPLRVAIKSYGDAIAADVGNWTSVLSEGEFVAMRTKHMPTPVAVSLPGWGVVHLRMAHAVYPYVGVDFGGGAHALFEPGSMLCTYSD